MTETARQERNRERLAECYPAFRAQLARVLVAMEARGFRPRIQEAWRDPADELRAFESGRSQVKRGFHSCTGLAGEKEALAADVLDDAAPLRPGPRYLIALAIEAQAAGLETGILWGLADGPRAATRAAIARGVLGLVTALGWDPTHVQVTGLSIRDALAGARPEAPTEVQA